MPAIGKFSDEKSIQELIGNLRKGAGLDELSVKYQCSRSLIERVLRRRGLTPQDLDPQYHEPVANPFVQGLPGGFVHEENVYAWRFFNYELKEDTLSQGMGEEGSRRQHQPARQTYSLPARSMSLR